MQLTVLLISLIGMGMISTAFVIVIRNSAVREEDYSQIVGPSYIIRRWWMIVLCAAGVVITMETLSPFPLHSSPGQEPQIIKAESGQWYWKLETNTAVVGQPIQFHVTTVDVNHGFAIYNPDDKIIAQTQAMPGYTNKLNVTFTEPGTHRIMCLEYCGLAHHAMITDFEVTQEN